MLARRDLSSLLRIWLWAGGFVLLPACFNPTVRDGGYACDATQQLACPDGFYCVNGLCRSSPAAAGGAAGSGGASGSQDAGAGGSGGSAGGSAGGGGTGGGGGNANNGLTDMAMSMPTPDMAQAPVPDMAHAPSCAHDICLSGVALDSSCDPCVTQICAVDSYCCHTKWSSLCVQEVGTVCGQTC